MYYRLISDLIRLFSAYDSKYATLYISDALFNSWDTFLEMEFLGEKGMYF